MRRLWPISPDAQPRASAQPAKPSLLVRLDRLNTLRAISIIGVFLFHVFSTVFDRSVSSVDRIVANSDVSLQGTEKLGLLLLSQVPRLVTIFFLISGYFVHRTFLLWIRRNHSYLAFTRFFIWRRFWRLVPPFWVALLLSYAFTYKNPLAWASIRKLLVNATLFKTLVPGYFFSVNYAHWYVAVQWQLDLLYPVFIYIIWRYSGRAALITQQCSRCSPTSYCHIFRISLIYITCHFVGVWSGRWAHTWQWRTPRKNASSPIQVGPPPLFPPD